MTISYLRQHSDKSPALRERLAVCSAKETLNHSTTTVTNHQVILPLARRCTLSNHDSIHSLDLNCVRLSRAPLAHNLPCSVQRYAINGCKETCLHGQLTNANSLALLMSANSKLTSSVATTDDVTLRYLHKSKRFYSPVYFARFIMK